MKTYQINLAQKSEIRAVIDFLSEIYRPMNPAAAINQRFVFARESGIAQGNLILARSRSGELIGVIRIVDRVMLINGVRLTCGGISSIGVKPEWRNRGVCSAMMKKALSLMMQKQKDISVLYARRALDGFYIPFGYQGVGSYGQLQIISFPSVGQKNLRTKNFQKDDFSFLQKSYKKTYYSLSGSIVRSKAIWNFIIDRVKSKISPAQIIIFYQGSRRIGYGVVKEQILVELGIEKKYFSQLVVWLKEQVCKSVSLHPGHPFVIYCRSNFNTILTERFALDGGYMAQSITESSILKKLGRSPGGQSLFAGGPNWIKSFFPNQFFHTSVLDEI